MDSSKNYKTAIVRRGISAPVKLLRRWGYLGRPGTNGRVLDYGCGKGLDKEYIGDECINFDPYYYPIMLDGLFDIILCTYVLNIVTLEEQTKILGNIESLLADSAYVYITVRRDIPEEGTETQRYVSRHDLPGFVTLYWNSKFELFRGDKLSFIKYRAMTSNVIIPSQVL